MCVNTYSHLFCVVSPEVNKPKPAVSAKETPTSMSTRIEGLTIQEDTKENEAEDEEGLIIFPYERLKVKSTNPVTGIDVTKREVIINHSIILFSKTLSDLITLLLELQTYLSSAEFREKFGITKENFYKLPKWRQNKLKLTLQLF